MDKSTTIPAGYRISVTTWENDADNYRTEILEGVKKEHIPFIVAVCNLMGSNCNGNGYGNLNSYTNNTVKINKLIEKLDELITLHPDRPKYCDSGGAVYENLLGELGFTGSEDFDTRVFDGIKIEYVPQQILLEDVTDQFT